MCAGNQVRRIHLSLPLVLGDTLGGLRSLLNDRGHWADDDDHLDRLHHSEHSLSISVLTWSLLREVGGRN